jgi:hypothetical protein
MYPNKIASSERIIRGIITIVGASCVCRYKDLLALGYVRNVILISQSS